MLEPDPNKRIGFRDLFNSHVMKIDYDLSNLST